MGWPGKRLVGPAALFANTRLPLVEPAFMRQPMAAHLTLLDGRHQQKLTAATPNILYIYIQRGDAFGTHVSTVHIQHSTFDIRHSTFHQLQDHIAQDEE